MMTVVSFSDTGIDPLRGLTVRAVSGRTTFPGGGSWAGFPTRARLVSGKKLRKELPKVPSLKKKKYETMKTLIGSVQLGVTLFCKGKHRYI